MRYTNAGSGLTLAAFIINILCLAIVVIDALFVSWPWIIALAWMIPMTVVSWGIYQGTRPNTVAFGVCTLLFVSFISGILLLCAPKDVKRY